MEQTLTTFDQVVYRGCGIDVHKDNVVATIKGEGIEEQTRTFSTFTSSLRELSDWLLSFGITHIAMESTGVYWKPVYNILEPHFDIILVNARHIKHVPGHKTDRKDSAWIAKLLLSGLLKGSFIPPKENRELRELYRYKRKLVAQRASEYNRVQKVLEDANIKIGSVLSDVFGVSGRAMIRAIIEGETNTEALADLAQKSLKNKREQLLLALEGCITDHHRFMLSLSMEAIQDLDGLIARTEQQIDKYLARYEAEMELLTTIPGVQKGTATAILAEIGADMSAFPSQHHLASWAGLCPGNNESAGKKKSEHISPGNKSLKAALTEASWAASLTKDSYLKRRYRSIAARRGIKRAMIATAHKILVAAYFILRDKVAYQEPDNEKWQQKRKQAQIRSYLRRLHELGISVPSQEQ